METRDKNVVDFVNLVGLCNKNHIKKLLFSEVHDNICMRRLKKLADDGLIERFKFDGNSFIYFTGKKPSKRLIHHDLYITDFVVKMLLKRYKILDFQRPFVIGPIISDAYIKYKDEDEKIRHLVLEIQLNNKIEDCVNKYIDFKNIILEHKKDFKSIPRIVVISDMSQRIELRKLKVLYDTTELKNIDYVLRG